MKRTIITLSFLLILLNTCLLCSCKNKTSTNSVDPLQRTQEYYGSSSGNAQSRGEKSVPDISKEAIRKEKINDASLNIKKLTFADTCFKLEKETFKVPFSYARISKNWKFNPEDYGLTSDYRLAPNTKTSENLELINDAVDYKIYVGFYNPYDVDISFAEAKIYSITIDITESENPPKVKLPNKLKWHDDFRGVLEHVGDPTKPFVHDVDNKLFHFSYVDNFESYLLIDIDEEVGVTRITIKKD